MSTTGPALPGLTRYGQRLSDWAQGLPPLAVDVVIACTCALYIVFQAAVDDRLEWWIPLLAAANALPLVLRRHYPFAVVAVTGVSTTWLAVTETLGHLPAAQLVATYTFAALSPPLKRLIAVVGTVIGVSISILVPDDDTLNLGLIAIAFALAYALGTSTRARRDRIAMLEERARRLAEEHAAAATRERERIAREMHDILAHSMSLVVVQAEAGPVVAHSDPEKAEEVFDTISATARDALAQLRRALGVLRSSEDARAPHPDLDGLPALVAAVEHPGLTVTLDEHGVRPAVPADIAATLYRIVQESLTNTVKHAEASRADVRLDWRDGAMELVVRDDGRGPAGHRPGDHGHGAGSGRLGLVGMRERVSAIGGRLTTGPVPDGKGFQVSVHVPLPKEPLG